MLHITLSAERSHTRDPELDPLGRDRVGYAEGMSPLALYDANHGCWKLGPRAEKERYALFSYGGVVLQAVEIERLEGHPEIDRSTIHGTILEPGHPVYDTYVDQPTPPKARGVRNPVTYLDSEVEHGPCRCGCGEQAGGRDFIPGHEQTALHQRVRQIGTVAEFIDWFDALHEPFRTRDKTET